MARKKRKPGGDRSKRRRRTEPPESLDLPDRRAIEGMMRQLLGELGGVGPGDTPLDQAQALMYQAFEENDPTERVRLAKEALQICPDCADAYTVLAEHAPSRKEALELYEKAVVAGERALGPDLFREAVGDFWGILETRPYMRARLELALALWTVGRRDEAIGHLQELLRLNPDDNQGVRYTLAGFLLDMDRDDDLERLLRQYPDEGTAAWAYTAALLAFRRQGDTPETRQLLQKARKANKHVPAYLLGEKFLPREQPPYYGLGDENEAIIYASSFLAGWKSTPGAIAWLREVAGKPARKKRIRTPRTEGPLPVVKQRLSRLPQPADVWQCDYRQLPVWTDFGGERKHPWALLITSRDDDLILAHDLSEESPSADRLWDKLAQAMERPLAGEPHRPTELQFRDAAVWQALRPHLEEIGITCVPAEDLDQVDALFGGLADHLRQEEPPSLLDMPGVTAEQVGSFYQAAASFYRQAPWKKLGYEQAIRVECDRFQGGPWYAVLMGQSGLTHGLALYEDLTALRETWADTASDEENARRTVATTVLFGEPDAIHPSEVEAARHYGWEVARPDAYPWVFHKERGLTIRPPLKWELELMEACLRTVPGFVDRRRPDDPSPEEVTVPAAGGELRLTLAWVPDD
ncbi:MAG TPA: hypothetical protein VNK04_12645 [Gemmataceae bacterium]|nr:hypothetical protein [Gemmataceae bacterium]